MYSQRPTQPSSMLQQSPAAFPTPPVPYSFLSALQIPKILTLPRPQASSAGSPQEIEQTPLISVSTYFHPTANIIHYVDPDVVLASSDSVYFYVHRQKLLHRSSNGFANLLPTSSTSHTDIQPYVHNRSAPPPSLSSPPLRGSEHPNSPSQHHNPSSPRQPNPRPSTPQTLLVVPERSDVLNILLLSVYNVSAERYAPSLDTLSLVPQAMLRYGYNPSELINPNTEITRLILHHVRTDALRVYVLAGSYNLESLAVSASRHVRTVATITDEQALMMGSIYLRRIMQLHVNRIAALKNILFVKPDGHRAGQPPCDGTDQRVQRAWALATAYLAWEARPDMPSVEIAKSLAPLLDHVRWLVPLWDSD